MTAKQQQPLIRDMDRPQLVKAYVKINPVPEVEAQAGEMSDQELRRALVRHVAGRMTDQQADEVLSAEKASPTETETETEQPRYRIDAVATVEVVRHDGEVTTALTSEIEDAVLQEIEGTGTLEFTVGIGGGEYGLAKVSIDGVEVKARRID